MLYKGTSKVRSDLGASVETSRVRQTSNRGQGFGLLRQYYSNSAAYVPGSIVTFAYMNPGHAPAVYPFYAPLRTASRNIIASDRYLVLPSLSVTVAC